MVLMVMVANIPPGATANDLMKNLAQEYENLGFEEGPSNTGEPTNRTSKNGCRTNAKVNT